VSEQQKNGKGASKIPLSSEQQDEIRRAAKRRQKGKMNLHTGQDILTAIREDRRQAAKEKAEAKKLHDRDQLHSRMTTILDEQAQKHKWSSITGALVCDYIDALITGNATTPDGLRGRPVMIVQQRFAMTCLVMRVPDGTLPGQSADWYKGRLQDAVNYRSRLETARAG
jgi:hypothetical protein